MNETTTYTFRVTQHAPDDFVCLVEELNLLAHGKTAREAFSEAAEQAQQAFITRINDAFLARERAQASA